MDENNLRNRIIGLGENSFKKSYYPELKNKVDELELFYEIFEKTNDIVIVIEQERKLIKYINNSVANHFWQKEDYVGLPVSNLLGTSFNQKLDNFINNECENKVIVNISHNNQNFALEANLNEIEIESKKQIIAIIRDITDHQLAQAKLEENNKKLQESNAIIKTINKELIIAKEKAEESDKLKSAFLANMSHEIRTPMNAIIGFSGLLANPNLTEDKKEHYIDIINSSGNQLLEIISDIVDISKIEAGQLKINYKEFNVNLVLEDLYTQFHHELEKNKPEVELILSKALPTSKSLIISDETRVKQLIINLLSNASKFTTTGTIEFGYYLKNYEKIVFFCKDTGIGIAPENHETVFERFRQTFNTKETQYGGTGLGLSISKGILNLMNGSIHLESDIGKGANFWFELPYHSNIKITFYGKAICPSDPEETAAE